MTKFSITRNGEPLNESLYTWDEKTKTLSTEENNLVLDFSGYNNCTFKTGFKCTFKTGSDCTFKTGPNCTFNTGSNCTFNTGSYCIFNTRWDCTFSTGYDCTFSTDYGCTFDTGSDCAFNTGSDCIFKTGFSCTFKTSYNCTFNTSYNCTFNTASNCTFNAGNNCTFNTSYNCTFTTGYNSILVRRDISEFYNISSVKNLTTAPYTVEGYVKDGYYYKDGEKQYKAIIADGILSEVIEHKGNVYKVKNYGSDNISYFIKDGDVCSHGETLKEAKESLIYKLSNRDTSQYKGYTLDTKVSKKEAIRMYRAITGACEHGTRMFVTLSGKVPRSLTIKKIIELTEGQYGNDTFKKFFTEVSE